MTYNKHTWETQELITTDKLNNLETGIDESVKVQPDIPLGHYSLSNLNNNRVSNLSNIFTYSSIQELIVDPRSGYKYYFVNVENSTDPSNEKEDLAIVEYDQLNRYRTSMLVKHGVTKKSWLHGQFVQFNYYNDNQAKVEFLIGNYGESIKLEYLDNTTVNFDDLPVFFTVDEPTSHSQIIDFDNNFTYSIIFVDNKNKTYTLNVHQYSLNPDSGTVNKLKSYSDTFDTPIGYISQGSSAAPARSYLNRESTGSMLFFTSGWTNLDSTYNEQSVRTYLIENGEMKAQTVIDHLENADTISTSTVKSRSGKISSIGQSGGTPLKTKYSEVEGSSQTKIGDKWVFTTNVITSRDSSHYNGEFGYSKRDSEIYQLAFGDHNLIDTLRNIGKPDFENYIGVDYETENLYNIFQVGSYQVSPTLLPNFPDAPQVLRMGDVSTTIGGTGLESIQLDVFYQGVVGKVKQVLTLQAYSQLNQVDIKFERTVRLFKGNADYGKPPVYMVGAWQMTPFTRIPSVNVLPLLNTSRNLLLPGVKKLITLANLSQYFKDDNITPESEGIIEVLPVEIPPDGDGKTTRIFQKYTTLDDSPKVYMRKVVVNTESVNGIFAMGIGGGYPSGKTFNDWVKVSSN